MEKQGEVRPDITPDVESRPGVKQATARELDNDVTKRLTQGAQQALQRTTNQDPPSAPTR